MENNKTRGYLPKECVLYILKLYNTQQKKHNDLLNEIEFIGYLKSRHMEKKCSNCNNHFVKCKDGEFISFLVNVLKYNKKNIKVSEILFPSFTDIYENITDTICHDLLWHDRFECKKCRYCLCVNCRIQAEYPARYIDIYTDKKRDGSVVCPLCKSVTQLNEYIQILRNQLNEQ